MKQKQISKQRHQLALAAFGLLVGATVLQGCKDDDVLTGQPSWLGNSIYERLEEDGQYKTMLRLIDDLGQHEVLSHTGSKTLFAANDSAFQAWFANNNWGVRNYDRLSLAQKKLLLNNAMVNNAYLIELLSNGKPVGDDKHPEEGRTMRRTTATNILDSVQIIKPSQMPDAPMWKYFRDRNENMVLLKSSSVNDAAPMIHFLPAFMKISKFTNADLELLTNHQANDINEAWVNGKKVVERDITCKNGYIQKVGGVIEASPNMADIVHQHPSMSRWAELMDRFSAPFRNDAATKEYNRLYNNEDSVYVLHYFSDLSANGRLEDDNGAYDLAPNGEKVRELLKFDPGWNQYINDSGEKNMNYDAGAMLVPTNEALEKWWNKEGKDFQVEYGVIDSIPAITLAKLIRVNMLPTLTEAIPSKFNQVLNDAKVEMGLTMADVDSVFMGCNGVVYMTNKVFAPAEYSAVSGPALAHPTVLDVIYWAITNLNFQPYLLSMDSRYSLILPSNDAMMWYIDPASYGTKEKDGLEAPQVLSFLIDDKGTLRAYRYDCTVSQDGSIELDESTRIEETESSIKKECLKRLMDQVIIVGDVEDGHEYYKSKGGTPLRITKAPDGRIAFAGGWQIKHNQVLPVNSKDIYEKVNGKTYIINGQMPLTTDMSVYMTLEEYKEEGKDSLFLSLLNYDGAGLLTSTTGGDAPKYASKWSKAENKNLRLLDNYNYTIYVPTDRAIQEEIDKGYLPTWEDYEAQTEEIWGTEEAAEQAKDVLKNIIINFLRYHIQDHAVLIGMAPEKYDEKEDGTKVPRYENTYETMKRNLSNGRFTPVTVNNEGGQMWVKDSQGNQFSVVTTNGLSNRICREYWFEDTDPNAPNPKYKTYMASDAVIQQIDGVLQYESQAAKKTWKELLNNNVRRK